MCIAADVRESQSQCQPNYELTIQAVSSAQWDHPQTGHVKDLITWNVSVVSPHATLQEARYLFNRLEVEGLVVYNGPTYVGFLTRSSLDPTRQASLGTTEESRVPELMDQSIEPASPDEMVLNVYRRMRQTGHNCLPVLDEKGKLAGLLTATTIEARFPSLAPLSNN